MTKDRQRTVAEEVSPTVARRRLRLAVRDARERAKLTQLEVAEQMEWSLSKVIRIENGDVSISPNDLRPLLSYLGVKDKAVVAALVADARVARTRQRQAWYQTPEIREHVTEPMRRVFEYEAEASVVRYYYVNFIPGPLQTREYADALMARYEEELPADLVRVRLESRQLRRQTLLTRAEAGDVDVRVLLDESVFMRPIGGPETFAAQLREIEDLSRRRIVKLRLMPFAVEAAVTNNASFDLLTRGEGRDAGEVLYRETGLRDETVEDIASTSRHRERYDLVWQEVADEDDTIDFIRKRIENLDATISNRQGDRQ
jgi:transcriptional regulator with XRE-family HTH domain